MTKGLLDNYGQPRYLFTDKLKTMTEQELWNTCKDMIWLSAYANNNPHSDYHWKCDACYDEYVRRGQTEIYGRAHKTVMKECGF